MKYLLSVAPLLLFFCPTLASESQPLSPQQVVDILFENSPKNEDIRLNYQISEAVSNQALGVYDLQSSAELGYTLNAMESLNGLNNLEDRTLNFNLAIGKTISTGSVITLSYSHLHQDSLLGLVTQNTRPPVIFQNIVGLQLEQPLLNNAFGTITRSQVQRAHVELRRARMAQMEQIEDLALTALRLYWDTYVAKETFKAALRARDKYKYLGQIVKRKQRVSLISPGEYNQVLAESAVQERLVKESSAEYLRLSEELFVLLYGGEAHFDDIEFNIENLIPPLPQAAEIRSTDLRSYQSAAAVVENAQAEVQEAVSASRPIFNLVARTQAAGLEQQDSEATSEMLSGAHPEYFVGIKFQTTLSGEQSKSKISEKRLRLILAQSQAQQAAIDLSRQERHLSRLVQATHQVAQIASETYDYRKKVVDEQELGFMQGRFALSQLTRSFVDLFQAEIKKIRAIGDYHMALHEWAASRDELFGGAKNAL